MIYSLTIKLTWELVVAHFSLFVIDFLYRILHGKRDCVLIHSLTGLTSGPSRVYGEFDVRQCNLEQHLIVLPYECYYACTNFLRERRSCMLLQYMQILTAPKETVISWLHIDLLNLKTIYTMHYISDKDSSIWVFSVGVYYWWKLFADPAYPGFTSW